MYSILKSDWKTWSLEERKKLRESIESLFGRKWFTAPSFAIYGGSSGLIDLGPPGCQVKNNVIRKWREHFVIEEDMLEVDTPAITPAKVLQVSGHEKKFADLIVKEILGTNSDFLAKQLEKQKTEGENKKKSRNSKEKKPEQKKGVAEALGAWRVDTYFEEWAEVQLENSEVPEESKDDIRKTLKGVSNYSPSEWTEIISKYDIRSPTGNKLSEPMPFNLMFESKIGPLGGHPAYLRPETAQGIFVNANRPYDSFGMRPPYAMAQVGSAYRNEITPKSGLLRVREFCMAEIEHFMSLNDDSHHRFCEVAELVVPLWSQQSQFENSEVKMIPLGQAVKEKIIHDETLGYFMARTFLFMKEIGLDETKLRFRQHLPKEMAHYASDCWDMEAFTTYGWVELVGHANRGTFDLQRHDEAGDTDLQASMIYKEPKTVLVWNVKLNMKALVARVKPIVGILSKTIKEWALDPSYSHVFEKISEDFESEGKSVFKIECEGIETELLKEDFALLKQVKKNIVQERFFPRVVEPSFGIGRIIYTLLEHSFGVRQEDEQRAVMKLNPLIAPWKCAVLPLQNASEITAALPVMRKKLRLLNISTWVDATSVSIGRRYSRMDELGVPFAITIDYPTVLVKEDQFGTITLRERDTCEQIRGPIDVICELIRKLSVGETTWVDVRKEFPIVRAASDESA